MNEPVQAAGKYWSAGVVVVIGSYFLLLTHSALNAWFTPDDTMNLYRSWFFPVGQLVKANLLFFQTSDFGRPLGSAWYRGIFAFAGFRPLPFHVANLLLLIGNMFLTYAVSRRLAGSRVVAAVAALLNCYHPRFAFLYFDTGFIYDVLCYFFYFSAFLIYLRARENDRGLSLRGLALCSVLYICALNSKEMAVTLPVMLVLYELVYHARGRREARGALVTGAITLVFLLGRTWGPDAITLNEAYRPTFTWNRFMESSRVFLDDLSLREKWFSSGTVLLLWAILLAIAWLARSKPLRFAWLFLMVTVAPVAFIYPRGAPQYYIPWFGWTLFAATAIVLLARLLFPRTPVRGPALLAALVLVLYPYYRALGWSAVTSVSLEAPVVRSISEQMRGLYAQVRPGTRFLFLDDPVRADWENLIMIVHLTYGDTSLVVDRVKKMSSRPSEQQLATYDHVIDYQGGRFLELTRPWKRRPTPMIAINPQGAEVWHADWRPVTRRFPARRGEALISKAVDLGATRPAIAPGTPFPASPLMPVVTPLEVRIDGRPCETLQKIGWPETMDYRLDFRVPEDAREGSAKVEITAGGLTGPAAMIPIGRRNK